MKKIYSLLAVLFAAFSMQAADINVTDAGLTGNVTWTKDNVYFLTERCFVESGDTLTIEAGTVVKGNAGSGANATALIIARGAYIIAKGTAQEPIIFTAASDDLSRVVDIAPGTKGLWGGLIVLGDASLNSNPGETEIEGLPSGDARSLYGGSNDDDNSGVIQYISIRYGGTSIAPNNDINGLTLGGVGRGTTIDHVEVIFNFDDGVEFFGGTVNTSYMVVAFCGDDSFDYDEGYRGKGQFWFTIQSDSTGDRMGEHDGGTDPETAMPYATPEIHNATWIGKGTGTNRTMTLRDNAGGFYFNSIFIDQGRGIDIEMLGGDQHSYKRYQDGQLKLENNVFWNVAGNTASDVFTITPAKFGGAADSANRVNAAIADVQAYFASANNTVTDPGFGSLTSNSRSHGQRSLDPRPSWNGPAYNTAMAAYNDPFFKQVSYKGAFSNDGDADFWVRGWTFMDELAYFPQTLTSNDADLSAQFSVTPNPASSIITVAAEGVQAGVATINVLDLQGRTVFSKEAQVSGDKLNAELNISDLTAGIYMVQAVVNGEAVATKKVVKQ